MSLVIVLCDSNMQMELDVKHRETSVLEKKEACYKIIILMMISRNVCNEYFIG